MVYKWPKWFNNCGGHSRFSRWHECWCDLYLATSPCSLLDVTPQVKSIQKLLLSWLEIMNSFVFGKTEITDEIANKAENFLLKFISNKNLDKFDDRWYELYQKKLHQFYVEKHTPRRSSMSQHIIRAYLQFLWLHPPFIEDISRDPLEYGYMFNDKDHLAPIVNRHLALPSDFPSPCTYLKCA